MGARIIQPVAPWPVEYFLFIYLPLFLKRFSYRNRRHFGCLHSPSPLPLMALSIHPSHLKFMSSFISFIHIYIIHTHTYTYPESTDLICIYYVVHYIVYHRLLVLTFHSLLKTCAIIVSKLHQLKIIKMPNLFYPPTQVRTISSPLHCLTQ